ncbi:unnamed protein product, partial [Phaeothamnion confervicola]
RAGNGGSHGGGRGGDGGGGCVGGPLSALQRCWKKTPLPWLRADPLEGAVLMDTEVQYLLSLRNTLAKVEIGAYYAGESFRDVALDIYQHCGVALVAVWSSDGAEQPVWSKTTPGLDTSVPGRKQAGEALGSTFDGGIFAATNRGAGGGGKDKSGSVHGSAIMGVVPAGVMLYPGMLYMVKPGDKGYIVAHMSGGVDGVAEYCRLRQRRRDLLNSGGRTRLGIGLPGGGGSGRGSIRLGAGGFSAARVAEASSDGNGGERSTERKSDRSGGSDTSSSRTNGAAGLGGSAYNGDDEPPKNGTTVHAGGMPSVPPPMPNGGGGSNSSAPALGRQLRYSRDHDEAAQAPPGEARAGGYPGRGSVAGSGGGGGGGGPQQPSLSPIRLRRRRSSLLTVDDDVKSYVVVITQSLAAVHRLVRALVHMPGVRGASDAPQAALAAAARWLRKQQQEAHARVEVVCPFYPWNAAVDRRHEADLRRTLPDGAVHFVRGPLTAKTIALARPVKARLVCLAAPQATLQSGAGDGGPDDEMIQVLADVLMAVGTHVRVVAALNIAHYAEQHAVLATRMRRLDDTGTRRLLALRPSDPLVTAGGKGGSSSVPAGLGASAGTGGKEG